MNKNYYIDGYNAGKDDTDPQPPDKFKFPQYFAEYYRGFLDGKSVREIQKEKAVQTILSDLYR